VPSGW